MKVLIAVDGSEPAVGACRLVGRLLMQGRDQVRIVVVLSYQLFPGSLVPGEYVPGEDEAASAVRDEIEKTTRAARRILEEAGFAPTIEHRFGNPPDEIVAAAEDWQPDIVVLGRRGVRGSIVCSAVCPSG